MKKSLVLFIIILCSFSLFSQEEKKDIAYHFFVGGGLSFEHISQEETTQNIWNINPNIGYSLTKNTILGLGFNFFHLKVKDPNFESTRMIFNVNPFVRYRKSISKKVGLYGELGGQFRVAQFEELRRIRITTEPKETTFRIYIGPGIDFAISERWFLNANWGILSLNRSTFEDTTDKSYLVELNMNPAAFNFSLNYLF